MSDHSNVAPAGYSLETALALAAVGYKLVPIPAGFKYPKGFGRWQEIATDDTAQVTAWLGATTHGFGLAMGLQPNGKHLFAVDIDGEAGMDTLITLLKEFGGQDLFMNTANQNTGNNGAHFIFEADHEVRNSAKQFASHIDIRGEGGQIVVGPTIHPNGNPYVWNKLLSNHPPLHAPTWVMERIAEMDRRSLPVAQLDVQRETSTDSPLDWANEHMDSAALLNTHGWQYSHNQGGDQFWVRPGKPVRDGHSAVLHDDGTLVVFTTEVGPEFGICKTGAGGTLVATPFDLYCIFEHGGAVADAMRHIRFTMMPQASRPANGPSDQGATPVPEGSGLNLPDEFWRARPVLEQIRQGAWSKGASPDAVFAGVLARYSANLHPSIMLPNWGTLDLFTIIEGHSGSGKSKASKTASNLYPGGLDSAVMMDRNVGSGEGLAESFFEWRDEDGNPCGSTKKGARKVRTRWGLHFSTDEGTALISSAGRIGSIIIPTLCSAWMGEAIGQLLADPTKSRMIAPHAVRVSAEVKIQTAHGWKLFADEYQSTGLAQRMLCLTALDPSIFERFEAGTAKPDWPGELELPTPFVLGTQSNGTRQPRELEVAPRIAAYLDRIEAQGHNPAWVGDPLDTHSNLTQLKVAGLLALWEDRPAIDDDDWALAGVVLQTHRSVRTKLQETQRLRLSDERHNRIEAEISKEVQIDDGKHKALVRRTVAALQARIDAGKPLGQGGLSAPQREVYEEAMFLLEAQGVVKEEGGRWVSNM